MISLGLIRALARLAGLDACVDQSGTWYLLIVGDRVLLRQGIDNDRTLLLIEVVLIIFAF